MSIDKCLDVASNDTLRERLKYSVKQDNLILVTGYCGQNIKVAELCEMLQSCQKEGILDKTLSLEEARSIFSSFYVNQTVGKTAFAGYYPSFHETF